MHEEVVTVAGAGIQLCTVLGMDEAGVAFTVLLLGAI